MRLKNKMKFDIYSMLSSIAQESALNEDQARGLMIFRLLTEAAQGHQGASFTIRGGEVLLEGTVFNQDESIMLPLGEFISTAENLGMKADISKTTPRNGCVTINWDKPVYPAAKIKMDPICVGAKPVSPDGIDDFIQEFVHPDAVNIFNVLIAKNSKNLTRIEIRVEEFEKELKDRFKDSSIYGSYIHNIVKIFRKSGWNIHIDEPGLYETYSPLYILSTSR